MTHSNKPLPRRGPARRIGRTIALVLPVFLVLTGTMAVATVNWSGNPGNSSSVLTASAERASEPAKARAPHTLLRDRLLTELQEKDPGIALTHLQQEVNARPSLAKHCVSLARALGRAAVKQYGPTRAQSFSRPVCDTAFAAGVAQQT
ncbi:hypothetical protein DSC45_22880 [Streptomyces sp. YIM 130001]|uniref:hypothetical protein n=1 Tax=Streptomyces sp. YIM 130001 TaxID=2259644 RepID=UPI000E659C3F|nr:hypothetical protein [Streptomyces sp. YIM 130001]RII13802.1 hypothetical protein DSC45_22880 [Streptomyces sp. YIM 130001]